MNTRTRFVFLMHPKEFKQEKAATGGGEHRLVHKGSGLVVGAEQERQDSEIEGDGIARRQIPAK